MLELTDAHGEQADAPVPALKAPGGHSAHESRWASALKAPTGHATGAVSPVPGHMNPAGQGRHAEALAGDQKPAVHGDASVAVGHPDPAGHTVHAAAWAGEVEPTGHGARPAAVQNAPAGHGAQAVAVTDE